MAKIYFNRLILESITIADIPERYMEAVKGYGRDFVNSHKMSPSEYYLLFGDMYEE